MKPIKSKKISISTQTEALSPTFFEFSEKENIETTYSRAVEFVNQCHSFFNSALQDNNNFSRYSFSKNNLRSDSLFKFPEVPNYFSIYTLMQDKNNVRKQSWELLEDERQASADLINLEQLQTDFMFMRNDLKSMSNSTMVINIDKKAANKESAKKCVKNFAANVQTGDLFDEQTKKVIEDIIHENVKENLRTLLNKNVEKKRVKLAKSNFQVTNIQPEHNILDYKRRKCDNDKKCIKSEMNFFSPQTMCSVRPSTPKLVNEMFKKISKEDIKAENCLKQQHLGDSLTDDDSVIFDDEEYEKLKHGSKSGNIIKYDDKLNTPMHSKVPKTRNCPNRKQKLNADLVTKTHPLQLTGKNKSKIDEKALNVIGLFTERGDIRPGIIDIIEQKKNTNSGSRKNVEFRQRRQPDLRQNSCNNYLSRAVSISSKVSSTESLVSAVYSDVKTDSDFEIVQIQQSQIKLRNKRF